jgi:hypothetical protein
MVNARMRRAVGWCLPVLLVFFAACEEEGVVQVHSLKFKGVEHIDESALKSVLATQVNSKIPWGRKAYFDRTRFEADIKRIEAFYVDHGYDAAHVTGYVVSIARGMRSILRSRWRRDRRCSLQASISSASVHRPRTSPRFEGEPARAGPATRSSAGARRARTRGQQARDRGYQPGRAVKKTTAPGNRRR